MSGLTEAEFKLLDELYFVTSYNELIDLLAINERVLNSVLSRLLEKELIVQMKYNEFLKDFEKLEQPEPDIFHQCSYVASRKGLLIHNTRS